MAGRPASGVARREDHLGSGGEVARADCFTVTFPVKRCRLDAVEGLQAPPDDLSIGFLLGLLVGEGHFGGDGRQPQVTLRMHVRHERLFRWLTTTFPGGRLYGPYHHGGRDYYQWMARGEYLRRFLAPLVAAHRDWLDDNAAVRFDGMCRRYGIAAGGSPAAHSEEGPAQG